MRATPAAIRPAGMLPVSDPAAKAYQFFAYPLAIQATDARTDDWVLSNYLQLEYDTRGWETDVPFTFFLFDYAASPWLETVRGTRRWFPAETITETVRSALAAGYYAYLVVDEYHVPRRRCYQDRHQAHDILVHGIDESAGTVSVLGYDEQMWFRSTVVGLAELAGAYQALDDDELANAPVVLYRLRTEPEFGYPPVRYDLDLALIRRSIEEFLHSADTSRHFSMLRRPRGFVYGAATYEHLERFVRLRAARELDYDIRPLQVLWEHKQLMTRRLHRLRDVLGSIDSLVAAAGTVEQSARALRTAMVRDHFQDGRRGFLDESLRLLEAVVTAELPMLTELLARLDDTVVDRPARQETDRTGRGELWPLSKSI